MTHTAVLDGDSIKTPGEPGAPDMWRYTGAPAVIVIDADNPDHWQRYAESYVANNEEYREHCKAHRVPRSAFGYDYGYYPVDVDDWQMIPDGPYCAACIDPANGYGNPNTQAEEEYPQAYHAELMQDGDDIGDRIVPRTCIGCGETLYDPND